MLEFLQDILTSIGDGINHLINALGDVFGGAHQYLSYVGTYISNIRTFISDWIPTPLIVVAVAVLAIDILFIILGANNS